MCGYLLVKSEQWAFATLITVLSFAVLWFFWCGHNWARILVLLTSLVALINLFSLEENNTLQKVIIFTEAIFAVYLLWWLNTKSVANYFKR